MWSGQLLGSDTGNRASWIFTKRGGGVSEGAYTSLNLATHVGDNPSAVQTNRAHLSQVLGVAPHRTRFMRAAHGADVHYVTEEVDFEVPEGDGLITRNSGVGLAALAADCVPVVMADVDHGVVAAVHCGWPGVVAEVVGATVQGMLEAGARTEQIQAIAGPAICGRCYAVSNERQSRVIAVVPEAASESTAGGPAVDIRRAVVVQLAAAGVAAKTVGDCTAEDEDLFSFRRDGVTGRQAGAIAFEVNPAQAG